MLSRLTNSEIALFGKALTHKTHGQRGFTLMEVLVAFTIFAVTFTAVLQILSTSTRNDEIAEKYGLAVSHAESLLARAGIETPLIAGETAGGLGQGMQWRQVVTPYREQADSWPAEDEAIFPYRVEVTISWGEGKRARSLTLATLRLGGTG